MLPVPHSVSISGSLALAASPYIRSVLYQISLYLFRPTTLGDLTQQGNGMIYSRSASWRGKILVIDGVIPHFYSKITICILVNIMMIRLFTAQTYNFSNR